MIRRARPQRLAFLFLFLAAGLAAHHAHAVIGKGAAASYFLELNGAFAGPLVSASGGLMAFPVVASVDFRTAQTVKTIAAPSQVPLQLVFEPASMTSPLQQWLTGALSNATLAVVRRDGAGRLVDRIVLFDARVTRLELTPLVAGQPVRLQVTILAPQVEMQPGSGPFAVPPTPKVPAPVGIRVEHAGGQMPEHEVLVAENVGFSRHIDESQSLDERRTASSSTLDCSDVDIVLPHAHIATWFSWYQQVLTQGLAAPERELRILLLGADGTVRPFVSLHGAGLRAFEPFNHPDIGMAVKVSLYCENVSLAFSAFAG